MEEKYESLKLENQLCFPLYAAAREITRAYKPFLDPLHLTYTQYVVMLVLWEEKCLSVKDLGKKLYLDSGTLTPLLKKLEQAGLVSRRRCNKDERVVYAEVTEEGMALRDRALEVPEKLGCCVPLTPEEGRELYRLLYKILECEK